MALSELEKNILRTKGVTDDGLARFESVGIHSKADFGTVGDAATLAALAGLAPAVADAVMTWATGATGRAPPPVVVETGDVVTCTHCKARQPKDYKAGDLCPACGRQAEPILACFWCGHSGPGRFCRSCGAEFVPTGELDLAVLLKRDGLPKDDIPAKLKALSAAEKDALWGRVRKGR
jgi:hypothetical protein